jgi:hypothetical protein
MTSNGETLEMKVVDIKMLWNFVVDIVLIRLRLKH